MPRLKTILQSKIFYILLSLFIIISFCLVSINKNNQEVPNLNVYTGTVTNLEVFPDHLNFILKGKNKIRCTYYFKDGENTYILGKKVKVSGLLQELSNNTIPNTFNYKKYLQNEGIFLNIKVNKIEIIKDENIFYKIKNAIIKRINKFDDVTKNYLYLFLLGDNYLEDDTETIYKENGIWHLFAISGMHISLFIFILNKLLIFFKHKDYLISLFLLYFMFLTNFSSSVMRVVIFYIISLINKKFNLELSKVQKLFLTGSLILIINPLLIYNVGFLYSFCITLSIFLFKNKINGSYINKLLKISILSFIVSLPITVSINYEINLLSILLNLFYVPFVTFLIFPLSILTFFIPYLSPLFEFLITLLEFTNNIFNQIDFKIIIPKIPFILILIYYLLIFLFYYKDNKKYLFYAFILILINIWLPKLDNNYYVYFLDVGQGDSAIFISPYKNEVIMIDTGGQDNSNYHISSNTITFLKSMGLKKIDLLILSHGDSDHAKETLYLLDKFKIDNIIINKNDVNALETKIKNNGHIVSNYNSKYYNFININDYLSSDENYSSIITLIKIYNYKFLFMGDAPKEVEEKLVNDYDISCDFLKVGHHGSNTSTSKLFLQKISLKYAIISVGRNNLYGHPKEEVLNNLKDIPIYRTDKDGTIEIKINRDNYNITTYEP